MTLSHLSSTLTLLSLHGPQPPPAPYILQPPHTCQPPHQSPHRLPSSPNPSPHTYPSVPTHTQSPPHPSPLNPQTPHIPAPPHTPDSPHIPAPHIHQSPTYSSPPHTPAPQPPAPTPTRHSPPSPQPPQPPGPSLTDFLRGSPLLLQLLTLPGPWRQQRDKWYRGSRSLRNAIALTQGPRLCGFSPQTHTFVVLALLHSPLVICLLFLGAALLFGFL